jgi:hypothetical protein
MSIGKKDKA